MEQKKTLRTEQLLFFLLIALVALANGLGNEIFGNYFKDVYHINAIQRGFIEFPRELPGVLCMVVMALLSGLGSLKIVLVAQLMASFGLIVLGLWTPSFGVMLVFVFINSMGMHLFMPLRDSIGMSLAEDGAVGRFVGCYTSVRSAASFTAALLVFIGFRTGFLSFHTKIKSVFVIGAVGFAMAACIAILLIRRVRHVQPERKKFRLIFRKQYKYYYMLTILQGVQKQIALVYGSWVVIDLLCKGADVMALLSIASNFLCIFFMRMLGRCMDRFGIKKMMMFDALTFIGVYTVYGFVVWGITGGVLAPDIWAFGIYFLFVCDRLSMQVGIVKAVYLRSIAWNEEDVTATLSTGLSLDHAVSIIAAMLGGYVWTDFGSHWVFFMAAAFSLGNLYIAIKIDPEKQREEALHHRAEKS